MCSTYRKSDVNVHCSVNGHKSTVQRVVTGYCTYDRCLRLQLKMLFDGIFMCFFLLTSNFFFFFFNNVCCFAKGVHGQRLMLFVWGQWRGKVLECLHS